MSKENTGVDVKGGPSARHDGPRSGWNEVALRAKNMVRGFPASLDERMKRDPVATVGIACAIGVGVGVLIGNRILRTVLASAVAQAAVELGRAWLRQGTTHAGGLQSNGTS